MHWFVHLKTRTKLAIGFGLMAALLAAVIAISILALHSIRDSEHSLTDVMTFRNNLNQQRAAVLTAVMREASPEQEPLLREINEWAKDNDAVLSRLAAQYRDVPELREIISEVEGVRSEFVRVRDTELIPMIRAGRGADAMELALGGQAQRFSQMRAGAENLAARVSDRARLRSRQVIWLLAILGALALLAAIGMTSLLDALIARPLEKMTAAAEKIARGEVEVELAADECGDEAGALRQAFLRMTRTLRVFAGRARQIADGDLTAQIKPQSENDVLGNAFLTMTNNVRGIVGDLVEAVNVLAASSSEIMASTTELASTAAETASAVTETTTTVEEIKQTSQHSSKKARVVSEEALKSAGIARDGKRAVDETIEDMSGIRTQMEAIAESILSLSAQSQAIGEIIATVDDLAAQSKLLAVNAAIEAAKAGDEGKGFAVVAQEVRSMAEQSKQATAQVRGILNDIRKATASAVLATEQGGKAVEAGVQQSNAAGASIGALAESIAGAAQAATQIAATSQQQFVGMDQVSLAMENIKVASTQTVASTRQAEIAARQLHDIGLKLKTITERFKV